MHFLEITIYFEFHVLQEYCVLEVPVQSKPVNERVCSPSSRKNVFPAWKIPQRNFFVVCTLHAEIF